MTETELKVKKTADGTVCLALTGEWRLGKVLPSADGVLAELAGQKVTLLSFDTSRLDGWDSMLVVLVTKICDAGRRNGASIDPSGLPAGVRKLMALAAPENQRSGMTRSAERARFLARVGDRALDQIEGVREALSFIGEVTLAFLKMLRGRADFRGIDLLVTIQQTGAQALPIVTLISLLIGMILAFIAAIQLRLFGAQIFVADVVGIGTVRVMGAVMVGVIMAGRSGAAFAAQLGTMQVNEEIDALETLGLSPVEFLVLPRMLALTLMMPLLCVYADLMGVVGGLIVGVGMLDLGARQYVNESLSSFKLTHFLVGLFHSFVFGIVVAASGCLRGLQCERSASAVGFAATSAVVTGIVCMVVATLIITLLCQVLRI